MLSTMVYNKPEKLLAPERGSSVCHLYTTNLNQGLNCLESPDATHLWSPPAISKNGKWIIWVTFLGKQ